MTNTNIIKLLAIKVKRGELALAKVPIPFRAEVEAEVNK